MRGDYVSSFSFVRHRYIDETLVIRVLTSVSQVPTSLVSRVPLLVKDIFKMKIKKIRRSKRNQEESDYEKL